MSNMYSIYSAFNATGIYIFKLNFRSMECQKKFKKIHTQKKNPKKFKKIYILKYQTI